MSYYQWHDVSRLAVKIAEEEPENKRCRDIPKHAEEIGYGNVPNDVLKAEENRLKKIRLSLRAKSFKVTLYITPKEPLLAYPNT